MSTVAGKLITAEQFATMPDPPDGSRQELVRGEIVSMPAPGFRHGVRQVRISRLLDQFVRPNQLGRITVKSGVITERGPDTVRGPDVCFWSKEQLPLDQEPIGYPDVAPDLCIEVLSSGNTLRIILEKLREYFAAGVRVVWIIDPDDRCVRVYRSPDEARLLHESATLTGEEVLPGFSCRVADLFVS